MHQQSYKQDVENQHVCETTKIYDYRDFAQVRHFKKDDRFVDLIHSTSSSCPWRCQNTVYEKTKRVEKCFIYGSTPGSLKATICASINLSLIKPAKTRKQSF